MNNRAKYYVHEIPEGYEARIEGNKVIIEIAETEDERIRKHIVKFIDEQYPTHGNLKEEKDKMLAYLVKEPEVRYVYPKFRVGDLIQPIHLESWDGPVRVKSIVEEFGSYDCESDPGEPLRYRSLPIKTADKEYELVKGGWTQKDEIMCKELVSFLKGDKVVLQHDCEIYSHWLENRMKQLITIDNEKKKSE